MKLKDILKEALQEAQSQVSLVLSEPEKSVVLKLAQAELAKEQDQDNKDSLNYIIKFLSGPGAADISKFFTDPKLSSYTGLALDEFMTDFILLDSESSPILNNQEKTIARNVENKWKNFINNNQKLHGSRQNKTEDKLPGGAADDMSDDLFDKQKLYKGAKHELEHTKDIKIAIEIAKDHLLEDPDYYEKLSKIEK